MARVFLPWPNSGRNHWLTIQRRQLNGDPVFELNRPYTSVEILARENSALAVGQGVVTLKSYLENLSDQPAVWRDVLSRCKDERHLSLMQWIEERLPSQSGRERFPKMHSPKHNLSVWMLYRAADLKCPEAPPRK